MRDNSSYMERRKQLLAFLLLNVIVSAATTWLVVSYMARQGVIPGQFVAPPGNTTPGLGEQNDQSGQPFPNIINGQMEVDTVIGAGDIQVERVVIRHIGGEEVSLAGWTLEDQQGQQFTFPALTIFSNGSVTVYTGVGISTVVELYWGLGEAVWAEGETVTLFDAEGNVQATFQIP